MKFSPHCGSRRHGHGIGLTEPLQPTRAAKPNGKRHRRVAARAAERRR